MKKRFHRIDSNSISNELLQYFSKLTVGCWEEAALISGGDLLPLQNDSPRLFDELKNGLRKVRLELRNICLLCQNPSPSNERFCETCFENMTPREKQVLRMRFGIGLPESDRKRLEDLKQEQQRTREGIRDIEQEAVRKLRHPSPNKRLKIFIET